MTSISPIDPDDIGYNQTSNPTLNELIEQRYSRRQTLFGGASAAAMAVFGGSIVAACGDGDGTSNLGGGGITASAGSATTLSAGKQVTLTGGVTGATANTTKAWTQTGGPTVTLTDPTGNPSFIAPAVAADTVLTFRLTATDGSSSSTADTTVTVQPAKLDFTATPKSLADVVSVPAGYTVTVLYRTGDPLLAGVPAYANNGTDTNFAGRAGDHHDGMSFFGLSGNTTSPDLANSTRGLLVMNHENINQQYLHPTGATTTAGGRRPTDEVIKEIEAHGVSVVEIARTGGTWAYVPGGALNRRITPFTPTSFSGPVRGNALLRTLYSPAGTDGRGTINNCANGDTPWATYLTCEENWAGYFRREAGDNARRTTALGAKSVTAFTRYGLNTGTGDALRAGNFNWATADTVASDTRIAKFNATVDATKAADGTGDFRNEPNQLGWVVEIDPYDATSTPRKRTALGRMNHEGCRIGRTVAGVRPAFYMGDDAQNEYIYKFVSATPWAAADATSTNRLALGDKYLDNGTLYVAKLNADGTGQWIPMVFGQNGITAANGTYAFSDQADVLTNVRLAGDVVGATKMDRPEWTAVNPVTGEMYCTLTNNTSRNISTNPTDAANPRAYTDPKLTGGATNGNANGHIIRLRETGDTSEATTFAWDIYAFGAGADLDPNNINLSGLDASNDFSSPDGLWFGRASNVMGQQKPLLFIETDDSNYTDVTNCMLLVAMPGNVNDGGTKTITNTLGGATATQATRVGKAPGTQLRRFLVGPKECEITGIDTTPDGRTVFVNIQHPGELAANPAAPTSNWPDTQATGTAPAATIRPRSATIAITKNDGGIVGL